MTKYVLKKDTPAFRSGYIFETDPKDEGVLLDKEGVSAFYENEIDNFDEWFEEVKRPDWEKPELNDLYFYVDDDGDIRTKFWMDGSVDEIRWSLCNCFKREKAAERYREYLKAIATVRQDEGFMVPSAGRCHGYGIGINCYGEPYAEQLYTDHYAGRFYFDSDEHASESTKKHPHEWRKILAYDWGKGGDDEN